MAQQIQLRRDVAADWTSVDPTLAEGEVGVETDTGKFKIGDGSTAWSSLDYFTTGAGAGTVDTSGTPVANEIARFTDADTIEGVSYSELRAAINVADGATDDTTIDNHIADTSDAHDASAISIADAGGLYTATDVEAALAEVKAIADAGGGGSVDTSGTPVANDIARFTDADTIEGISYSELRTAINVEDGADVTDAVNVAAAGAVMESDTSTASMSFVVDEDDMASNSATKVPTQQSVKKYVDDNGGSPPRIWLDATRFAGTFGSPNGGSSSGAASAYVPAWKMDAAATEIVGTSVLIPSGWSTLDVDLYWSNNGTGAGDVVWGSVRAYASSGDSVNSPAFTIDPTVTASAVTVEDQVVMTTLVSGVTASSLEPLFLAVARIGGDGDDTLAGDANLLGVMLTKAS